MIKPYKYLDINCSPLAVAALILRELVNEPILKYDDLLSLVSNTLGEKATVNFLPALNLLFLLGKVNYSKDLDSIELHQ